VFLLLLLVPYFFQYIYHHSLTHKRNQEAREQHKHKNDLHGKQKIRAGIIIAKHFGTHHATSLVLNTVGIYSLQNQHRSQRGKY